MSAEDVLAAHQIVYQCDGDYGEARWIECTCDYEQRDNWTGDTEAEHRTHVAAALAEAGIGSLAQARAEGADLLHEVWLAIHNQRFDETPPDSTYHGVLNAQLTLERIAREHGYSDIRAARAAAQQPPSP